jgi:hypothetical protein
MEAAGSSGILLTLYQTTQHHITEDKSVYLIVICVCPLYNPFYLKLLRIVYHCHKIWLSVHTSACSRRMQQRSAKTVTLNCFSYGVY